MKKTFLIQFTSDETTRWRADDNEVANTLKFIANSVAQSVTLGNSPSVEVCLDNRQPELALG